MQIPKEIKYFKVLNENTIRIKLKTNEDRFLSGKITQKILNSIIPEKNKNQKSLI